MSMWFSDIIVVPSDLFAQHSVADGSNTRVSRL